MPEGVLCSSSRSNRRDRFLLIICVGSPAAVVGAPCPPAIERILAQRNCDLEAGPFLHSRRIDKYHVDKDRLGRGCDLFFEFREAALQVIHSAPLDSLSCLLLAKNLPTMDVALSRAYFITAR